MASSDKLKDQQPTGAFEMPANATVVAGGKPQYTTVVSGPQEHDHSNLTVHPHEHRDHHDHGKHHDRDDKHVDVEIKAKGHSTSDGKKTAEIKIDAHSEGSDNSKPLRKRGERRKSMERPKEAPAPAAAPGEPVKTPKDFSFKLDAHTNEEGTKEIDAKFHFEGKRDHNDDEKEKKRGPDEPSKAKETMGKLAEVIGTKIAEHKDKKESEPEIIEPRNAATHSGGMGNKIKAKVKAKIGDAIQNAATEMLVRKPGDEPRDLNMSIKHHMEQANRLEREAFVEEQMSHDHNLGRNERKEASRRAEDAKYRAKVEVATAEAEKHVLESH